MDVHRIPADEASVRKFVEELWLPYHRDLEATVDRHALAADVELVEEELEFRLDRLDSEDYEAWVAVDGSASEGGDDDVAGDADPLGDGVLAGFVTAERDEAPSVFDRPDRLNVADVFVREPYRGTGLATDLIGHVADRARELGCGELALEVDVDNERAIAFYEKLGFETGRRHMAVDVAEL